LARGEVEGAGHGHDVAPHGGILPAGREHRRARLHRRLSIRTGGPDMQRFLGRYGEIAYTLLRVVAGLMFAVHGAQKLFGFLGGRQMPVGSLFWVGGVIELVGGLLIAIGLFTSWAAFIASGEMAVEY